MAGRLLVDIIQQIARNGDTGAAAARLTRELTDYEGFTDAFRNGDLDNFLRNEGTTDDVLRNADSVPARLSVLSKYIANTDNMRQSGPEILDELREYMGDLYDVPALRLLAVSEVQNVRRTLRQADSAPAAAADNAAPSSTAADEVSPNAPAARSGTHESAPETASESSTPDRSGDDDAEHLVHMAEAATPANAGRPNAAPTNTGGPTTASRAPSEDPIENAIAGGAEATITRADGSIVNLGARGSFNEATAAPSGTGTSRAADNTADANAPRQGDDDAQTSADGAPREAETPDPAPTPEQGGGGGRGSDGSGGDGGNGNGRGNGPNDPADAGPSAARVINAGDSVGRAANSWAIRPGFLRFMFHRTLVYDKVRLAVRDIGARVTDSFRPMFQNEGEGLNSLRGLLNEIPESGDISQVRQQYSEIRGSLQTQLDNIDSTIANLNEKIARESSRGGGFWQGILNPLSLTRLDSYTTGNVFRFGDPQIKGLERYVENLQKIRNDTEEVFRQTDNLFNNANSNIVDPARIDTIVNGSENPNGIENILRRSNHVLDELALMDNHEIAPSFREGLVRSINEGLYIPEYAITNPERIRTIVGKQNNELAGFSSIEQFRRQHDEESGETVGRTLKLINPINQHLAHGQAHESMFHIRRMFHKERSTINPETGSVDTKEVIPGDFLSIMRAKTDDDVARLGITRAQYDTFVKQLSDSIDHLMQGSGGASGSRRRDRVFLENTETYSRARRYRGIVDGILPGSRDQILAPEVFKPHIRDPLVTRLLWNPLGYGDFVERSNRILPRILPNLREFSPIWRATDDAGKASWDFNGSFLVNLLNPTTYSLGVVGLLGFNVASDFTHDGNFDENNNILGFNTPVPMIGYLVEPWRPTLSVWRTVADVVTGNFGNEWSNNGDIARVAGGTAESSGGADTVIAADTARADATRAAQGAGQSGATQSTALSPQQLAVRNSLQRIGAPAGNMAALTAALQARLSTMSPEAIAVLNNNDARMDELAAIIMANDTEAFNDFNNTLQSYIAGLNSGGSDDAISDEEITASVLNNVDRTTTAQADIEAYSRTVRERLEDLDPAIQAALASNPALLGQFAAGIINQDETAITALLAQIETDREAAEDLEDNTDPASQNGNGQGGSDANDSAPREDLRTSFDNALMPEFMPDQQTNSAINFVSAGARGAWDSTRNWSGYMWNNHRQLTIYGGIGLGILGVLNARNLFDTAKNGVIQTAKIGGWLILGLFIAKAISDRNPVGSSSDNADADGGQTTISLDDLNEAQVNEVSNFLAAYTAHMESLDPVDRPTFTTAEEFFAYAQEEVGLTLSDDVQTALTPMVSTLTQLEPEEMANVMSTITQDGEAAFDDENLAGTFSGVSGASDEAVRPIDVARMDVGSRDQVNLQGNGCFMVATSTQGPGQFLPEMNPDVSVLKPGNEDAVPNRAAQLDLCLPNAAELHA